MNSRLITPYEAKMDKENPLSEYPRPILKRDSYFSLNGSWDFCFSKDGKADYGEKILVPFPPESALSGIARGHADGEALYYRKSFALPECFIKDCDFLI